MGVKDLTSEYTKRMDDITSRAQDWSIMGQIMGQRRGMVGSLIAQTGINDLNKEANDVATLFEKRLEAQAKKDRAIARKQQQQNVNAITTVNETRTPPGVNRSPLAPDATDPKWIPNKPGFSTEVEYPGGENAYIPPPNWDNIPYQQNNLVDHTVKSTVNPTQKAMGNHISRAKMAIEASRRKREEMAKGKSLVRTPMGPSMGSSMGSEEYVTNASPWMNAPVAGNQGESARGMGIGNLRDPSTNPSVYTTGGGAPNSKRVQFGDETLPINNDDVLKSKNGIPSGTISRIGDKVKSASINQQQSGTFVGNFNRYIPSGGPVNYNDRNATNGVPQGEIENYIVKAAIERGIDPTEALTVVAGEGGPNNPVLRNYAGEPAWGPFQLHVVAEDFRPGFERDRAVALANPSQGYVGDQFIAATGLHPSDPRAWKLAVEFALDYAAKAGSWAAWYGAKNLPNGRHTKVTGTPKGLSEEAKYYAGLR